MTAAPNNTRDKQAGRFQKGQSGNPSGRPRGARGKLAALAERLLEADAEEIFKSVIAAAKGGDLQAARLVLERVWPAGKERPVTFRLAALASAEDASMALADIAKATAKGELTPSEARDVAALIESFVRTFEARELEERLAEVEKAMGKS